MNDGGPAFPDFTEEEPAPLPHEVSGHGQYMLECLHCREYIHPDHFVDPCPARAKPEEVKP